MPRAHRALDTVIALLQRVTRASVRIDGQRVAAIDRGVLALIGVEHADQNEEADALARRIHGIRMFADEQDRMNLDLISSNGAALLVPQFTLAADTTRGRRPGFSTAAPPDVASVLFDRLCARFREPFADQASSRVATGVFGASMQVALVNDGPVTFLVRS